MRPPVAAPRLRAVTLDAMGTLVRLDDPFGRLHAALRERLGLDLEPGRVERALRAEMAYYRAHCGEGVDAASLGDLRLRCAAILREGLGRRELALGALVGTLLAALRLEPFEDAGPALDALRERGLELCLLSNWDCSLGEVIAPLGLGPFAAVVTSGSAGASKPDPAIFAHALRALGGPAPAAVLHVGDSPREDVEGARAAGLCAWLCERPPGLAGAVAEADRLLGLPA